ncbi:MAG: hypothetical protein EOP10_10325 [Proteobacteria bacterium]|nr:MAG: hypothetical protein EOP10_10325 [Pseudomonadota bacterium]
MKQSTFIIGVWLVITSCGDSKFKGNSGSTAPAAAGENAAPETKPETTTETKTETKVEPVEKPKTVDGITNTKNNVIFGETGVYRVGDGKATNTSCKQTVLPFDLEGSDYSFLFNVVEDDTSVTFQVGRICGVDTEDSNFFTVESLDSKTKLNSTKFNKVVVGDSDAPFTPFSAPIVLKKGSYAIRVISEKKSAFDKDRDDFVVGNIKVQANKPIIGTNIQTN